MIRDISRRYYEVWGSEQAQNSFLKGLLIVIGVLFLVQSLALAIVSTRKPVLIAISENDTALLSCNPPSQSLLEEELRRQVTRYIEAHYTWDYTTIDQAHAEAARYVASAFQKEFQQANAAQVKIAKDKKLFQKVYLSKLETDPKALTARVELDRILQVDGFRAITPLTLDLTLQAGPRTEANPEGLYITGEKIVPAP